MPHIRVRRVRRDRLAARLDAGMHCRLTLLSAPAGYGKTTLLVDWLRARIPETQPPGAAAWLALDEGDNDPVQFLRLLVAALRPLVPQIDEAAPEMMQGPQPLPLRTVVAVLINELVASPREIILVLEDYHVIREPAIHEAITFLLEHLPPLLHVVIATREDPPFPLTRWRAEGTLCELRAADLRFTSGEAAEFLREIMGRPVTAADAAKLTARTEGWAAGLQLAALSIPAGEDPSSVTAACDEDHRDIVEYLGAEVLARQPRSIQSFLLRTSVLNRLSGPLCEAVLGAERPDGGVQAMLEKLARANLFLTPLDEGRRWYRYHQLFAELLRALLYRAEPGLAPELHRRASAWYEQHGFVQEAIQHALAARDPDRAAYLIEQHGMAIFYLGHVRTALSWFDALPAELVRSRPLLCTIYAYALGVTNQREAAENYLQATERHLGPDLPPDEAAGHRARVDSLRAIMVGSRGDLTRSIDLAVQAMDLLPASEVMGRMPARIIAHREMGDVRSAPERALVAVAEQAKAAGLLILARVAMSELARLYVLQGRLSRAASALAEGERILSLDILLGLPSNRFGLGDLLRERNELGEAERVLRQGTGAITEANIVDAYVAARGYIALARLRQAQDDSRGAMGAIGQFTDLARRREFTEPVIARAAAARAHLWLMQGYLAAASHWAHTSGLSLDDQVGHLQELEYLVFARVLIAKKRGTVLALLDRLLQKAEAKGRLGSAIEILAVRALAHQAVGNPARAMQDLERALAHGEPEGYVRVFVDEGAPMATLLRRARARGVAPEYATRLLETFGTRTVDSGRPGPAQHGSDGRVQAHAEALSQLMEPLTRREREVLRFLVTEVSNQEIAKRLFITTATVKKHVYHIFGKLGVANRTQAVAKAKALDLD